MVLSNLTETFTIPFSLRVKNDAHIFLCDGDDVQNDNCYWFLLQAYGGRKSATRECRQNTKTTLKNNCFIDLNVKYVLLDGVVFREINCLVPAPGGLPEVPFRGGVVTFHPGK